MSEQIQEIVTLEGRVGEYVVSGVMAKKSGESLHFRIDLRHSIPITNSNEQLVIQTLEGPVGSALPASPRD